MQSKSATLNSRTFTAVKNKHCDDDQSSLISSIFVFNESVRLVLKKTTTKFTPPIADQAQHLLVVYCEGMSDYSSRTTYRPISINKLLLATELLDTFS